MNKSELMSETERSKIKQYLTPLYAELKKHNIIISDSYIDSVGALYIYIKFEENEIINNHNLITMRDYYKELYSERDYLDISFIREENAMRISLTNKVLSEVLD